MAAQSSSNVIDTPDVDSTPLATPTLQDLSNELNSVADWHSLGVKLGVQSHELTTIEKDHRGDNVRCKHEMLGRWLHSAKLPTWNRVADALWQMEERAVAVKIQTKYCSSSTDTVPQMSELTLAEQTRPQGGAETQMTGSRSPLCTVSNLASPPPSQTPVVLGETSPPYLHSVPQMSVLMRTQLMQPQGATVEAQMSPPSSLSKVPDHSFPPQHTLQPAVAHGTPRHQVHSDLALARPSMATVGYSSSPIGVEQDEEVAAVTAQNKRNITAKYAALLINVYKTLQEKRFDIREFRLFLIVRFPPGDCIPQSEDFGEIFEAITRNGLWDFWNYQLLEDIVHQFGADDDQLNDWVKEYKAHLAGFKACTKIIDYIAVVESDSSFDESDQDQPTQPKQAKYDRKYYHKLSLRLKVKVTDQSLSYVDDIWRSVSQYLLLPPLSAFLDHIYKSSITVVWLIPTGLVPQLLKQIHEAGDFFHQHHIASVTLHDRCVYDEEISIMEQRQSMVVHDPQQLLQACKQGDLEAALKLLATDINVDIKDTGGETPLIWASYYGHLNVVSPLLCCEANVNAQNKKGWTPLLAASYHGHSTIVSLLLAHQADVNAQHEDGRTALYSASFDGNTGIVESLLLAGANPDTQEKNGASPLSVAAQEGHLDVCRLLIAQGANINSQKKEILTEHQGVRLRTAMMTAMMTDVPVVKVNGVENLATNTLSHSQSHCVCIEPWILSTCSNPRSESLPGDLCHQYLPPIPTLTTPAVLLYNLGLSQLVPSLEMAAARSCIMLLVVLFSFSSDHADGVIFPADTCHYIQQLIKRFKESSGCGISSIIHPPMPCFGEEHGHKYAQLPTILLWDPNITYPHFCRETLSRCIHCGLHMREAYWNDGSSAATQPRTLHGYEDIVFLVSVVYTCDNNHRLLAHDERVLQCIPSNIALPFELFYRTGFTQELASMCTAFVRNGLNFRNMETLILEQRWESFAKQQQMKHLLEGETLKSDEFWSSELSKAPSNDLLSKCFLARFLRDEQLYLREITSIDTSESISFDHTFKVATNIGYLREDKVWVPQYNGLFIVMNSKGQVLTWQLTKGTKFQEIQCLLHDLHLRAQSQQNRISTVFINDCCKLRDKIKGELGKEVTVKLDVFHAVQRITRTLCKRHPLLHNCTEDLRLVFRKDGDCEVNRKSHTPGPDAMLEKMNAFVDKWKNAKDEHGIPLFKQATIHAISNLKVHIMAGCLSDIPTGGGTNRNERFHSHIKSFFNRSRIGILLAYALLTVIIHSHNTVVTTKGRRVCRPIIASPFQREPHLNLRPIGIMPKMRCLQDGNEHFEIDLRDCEIDIEMVESIYTTALSKLQIARQLAHMKLEQLKGSVFNFKPFTALPRTQDMFLRECDSTRLLTHYGLVLTPSQRDGNCFFTSVAINLSKSSNWSQTLTRIGLSPDSDVPMVARTLRQQFVQELVEHQETYENFMETGIDYLLEAKKFLQDGFFAHALGDTMPLALATVLQATIIIFTSNQEHPIYITPNLITTEEAIILVYDPSGSGHYDAALPYQDPEQVTSLHHIPTKQSPQIRCRCGVNSQSEERKSCLPLAHSLTRCKCYKASQPCTSLCGCKNCGNPHGISPAKTALRKRRQPHMLEKDIPPSKKFAVERGEIVSSSIWSDLETIILKEISIASKEYTHHSVTKLYNDIVYYSTCCFCTHTLPENAILREKSLQQVSCKLRTFNHTITTHD